MGRDVLAPNATFRYAAASMVMSQARNVQPRLNNPSQLLALSSRIEIIVTSTNL
jgi:hypothetical protein